MRTNIAAIALSTVAFLACSSTANHPDGGGGSAGSVGIGGKTGSGGSPGAGGAGGSADAGATDAADAGNACATAVLQGTCTTEGATCSNGCTDVCQFCNLLRCASGHWTTVEVAPAPCFTCGPSAHCQVNAQYCYTVVGGAIGSTPTYECRSTPNACRPTPTCACLRDQSMGGSTCTDSTGDAGAGRITVTLQAP